MNVDVSALINPATLNDNSVSDAMHTPMMMGNNDKYTLVVCDSPRITRAQNTANNGIVAFTENKTITYFFLLRFHYRNTEQFSSDAQISRYEY